MGNKMERRIIETEITEEDRRIEGGLRPQTLDDYIGQEKAKKNLRIYIEAANREAILWIMYCSTARRDWARPHWPGSLLTKWASI